MYNSEIRYLASLTDIELRNKELENWQYYKGNHWPYWIGPKVSGSSVEDSKTLAELQKIFQQSNVIGECVDLYSNALMSKEPEWSLSLITDPLKPAKPEPTPESDRPSPESFQGPNPEPKDQEPNQAALDMAENILKAWIDSIKPQFLDTKGGVSGDPYLAATVYLLTYGRAYLRVYQPGYLSSRKEPYKRIMVQAPDPSSVVVSRDSQGVLTKLTYNYAEGGKEEQELDYQTGKVTIRVYDTKSKTPNTTYTLDLGYRYSIIEIVREPIITESMKRLQNSINLALTMKSRNTVQAGFLERILLNAQPPGQWVQDPSTGQQRFIPGAFNIGPGVTSFLSGQPIEDEAGNLTGFTNPSISYRDPVDPDTFIKSVNHDKELIYLESDLGHLLVQGDGNLSGVSRKTLKDNHVSRAMALGQPLAYSISEVYSIVLALLTGTPDKYKVACKLSYNFGQPLPEEQDLTIKTQAAGLMSRSTAMKRLGIEDPDAEQRLILRERAEDVASGAEPIGDGSGLGKPQESDNEKPEESDDKEPVNSTDPQSNSKAGATNG